LLTRRPPHRKPLLHAIAAAAITIALTVSTDCIAMHRVRDLPFNLLTDNVIASIFIGILVFVYERRRNRYLAEKLNTVFLMNHHIRNALQPILMTEPSSKEAAEQIRDSVARIDWALREILTGRASSVEPHSTSVLRRRTADPRE
jgi:hypothetical protein